MFVRYKERVGIHLKNDSADLHRSREQHMRARFSKWSALKTASAIVLALMVSPATVAGDHHEAGEREESTLTRELEPFNSIRFSGAFVGEISVDGSEEITIDGYGDLEKQIQIRVKDGELEIKHASHSWWDKAIEISISATTLERVIIDGAGDFEIDGIDSERFTLKLPGAAEVEVSGECGELIIVISGAASVDAEDLECDKAKVRISGTGQIALHANSEVEAKISGLGSIEIYGEPDLVEKRIAGLGHIEVH
jgi:hypothetical protein